MTNKSAQIAMALALTANASAATYEQLKQDQILSGFRTRAVYLNGSGKAMGARFEHDRTGFTLDLLQIQSVPQAFVWVNSLATSNMGEPHTQEHLLLSKGKAGRDLQAHETMSLVGSTAFVSSWRTCYPFHTVAGPKAFFEHLERQMNAMLFPDYSDEEILREVRNFGVTENPTDKTLRLEEKGSIYNEMVSSMTQASRIVYFERQKQVFGPEHTLTFNSGGDPPAIRQMRSEHIRRFHNDAYQLGNMGAVASFAGSVDIDSVLKSTDQILSRLQGTRPVKKVQVRFPRPQPAPLGTIRIADYPHLNEQQPSPIYMTWPVVEGLTPSDEQLFSLFFDNFAGDPSTNLYKRIIDGRTRKIDIGARSVGNGVGDDLGMLASVVFPDANPSHINEARLVELRTQVLDELRVIAGWADGSAELAEFTRRLKSRIVEARRDMAKFVNSPPQFGFRSTGAGWIGQLTQLNRYPGFRKSVTLTPELDAVEALLSKPGNPYRDAIARWKLLENTPYVAGAKPLPALVARQAAERDARASAEVERLKAVYKVADGQDAIRRYKSEYDAATATLEKLDADTQLPAFTDAPPMTPDDTLDFRSVQVGGVTSVNSRFAGMTSATAGVALNAAAVDKEHLVYLAAVPILLTSTGVIRDGKAVSYEEMSEALKNEILGLNASFSSNPVTGRVEVVVRGSGNDLAEAQRSVEWMRLVLNSPNWRMENIARLRDVVDQSLNAMRTTMSRAEESWVRDPATAWWRQDALLLTSSSFLTRAFHYQRLRWLLKDPGDAALQLAGSKFFDEVAVLGGVPRTQLRTRLAEVVAAVPAEVKPIAADAARDLEALLSDIPDSSLAVDWSAVCMQMKADWLVNPATTLAQLDATRKALLRKAGARMFLIGSPENEPKLMATMAGLSGDLSSAAMPSPSRETGVISKRYMSREKNAEAPVYVALAAPSMQGGVVMNSTPSTGYDNLDRESLLKYLAGTTFGGGGAHALFLKTWASGLAYSNGPASPLASGRFTYYAERTPELPQTLRFVIDEIKKSSRTVDRLDYAISAAFSSSSAQAFESRGEEIAARIVDGLTQEKIRKFREALLALRKQQGLMPEIYKRVDAHYASIFPGYDAKVAPVKDAYFFVIGPEKQLALYEDYLKSAVGAEAKLHRLYGRDFWIVP